MASDHFSPPLRLPHWAGPGYQPPHPSPAATFAPDNLVSTCSQTDSSRIYITSCLASAQNLPVALQSLPWAQSPTRPDLPCLVDLITHPSLSLTLLHPTSFLAIPQSYKTRFHPRTFALAVSSAWNALPPLDSFPSLLGLHISSQWHLSDRHPPNTAHLLSQL